MTLERQCDHEYLEEVRNNIDQYDAILSLACGVGVQFMAEKYFQMPVLPGVDTCFMGVGALNAEYGPKGVRDAGSVFWPSPPASVLYPGAPKGFLTDPAEAQQKENAKLTKISTAHGS